jgi:hypothetical protein
MTIDPIAQRANETGWTREAKKAEADRKRAAKQAKDKAAAAAFWKTVRSYVAGTWDFFLRNLLLWVAIAGLVSVATWEWWNTARGWEKLYPAAGAFVYAGAIGAVVMYFWGFRMWREFGKTAAGLVDKVDDDLTQLTPQERVLLRSTRKDSMIWLSATVAAYFVCVVGVFIATATAAEVAKRAAEESRIELNRLIIARDDLKARVELNDPELMEMAVASDRRTLKALEDTARGTYDMPDLEPGSGCPAPPKKFMMERLCVQANGGIDPFNGEVMAGIRSEIERGDKRVKDATADAEALEKLEDQVDNFHVVQGDETAAALGDMLSIDKAGGSALSWLLLILSSLFLYGGGWLGDWVFERIEALRPGARRKTGVA